MFCTERKDRRFAPFVTDNELPSLTAARRLTELPITRRLKIDTVLPNFVVPRTEREEAKAVKLSTEVSVVDPADTKPWAEKVDPRRTKLRTEKEDARFTCESTDKCSETRAPPRMERELPTEKKSVTDIRVWTLQEPIMLSPDETRAKCRKDDEEPI